MNTKIQELINAINEIDSFEDYVLVAKALGDNDEYRIRILTGIEINKSFEQAFECVDKINDILSKYDLQINKADLPKRVITKDYVNLDISHYGGVKYFISNGYMCSAISYYFSDGTTNGICVRFEKDDDFSRVIEFSDERIISKDPNDIEVSSYIDNPYNMPHLCKGLSLEELEACEDIIDHLVIDFPDPRHINDSPLATKYTGNFIDKDKIYKNKK